MRQKTLVPFRAADADLNESELRPHSDGLSKATTRSARKASPSKVILPKEGGRGLAVTAVINGNEYRFTEYESKNYFPLPGKYQAKSIEAMCRSVRRGKPQGPPQGADLIVETFVRLFMARRLSSGVLDPKVWNDYVLAFREMADELSNLPVDDMITACKFHCDLAMWKAVGDKNPEPELPKLRGELPGVFHGIVKRDLRRRIVKRDLAFVYSLQKGTKTAWPAVSDEKLQDSLLGHLRILSVRAPPSEVERRHEVLEDPVVIRELQSIFRIGDLPFPNDLVPTPSACLENPRRHGGQLGRYSSLLGKVPERVSLSRLEESYEGARERLIDRAKSLHEATLTDTGLAPRGSDVWLPKDKQQEGEVPYAGSKNGYTSFLPQPRSIRQARISRVSAIKEPGKIRTVTVGSADRGLALQSLQSMMLTAWKSCRHSTMKDEDLTPRIQKLADMELPPNTGKWQWYSVDYKSATDLLHEEVTLDLLRTIRYQRSSSTLLRVAELDSLWGDILEYPLSAVKAALARSRQLGELEVLIARSRSIFQEWAWEGGGITADKYSMLPKACFRVKNPDMRFLGTDEFWTLSKKRRGKLFLEMSEEMHKKTLWVRKERGQLMGHWLSFPLLCAANLACVIQAAHSYAKDKGLSPSVARLIWKNSLINGDDTIFRAPEDFMPYVTTSTSALGFKFSIGKNYRSDFFAQMNSQTFLIRDGKVRRIGYLSQKLYYGVSPKTGTSLADPIAVAKDTERMLSLVPWSAGFAFSVMKDRVSHLYESGSQFAPNWFLPVGLGGLGLDPTYSLALGSNFHITSAQRRMATWFASKPEVPKLLEAVVDGVTPREVVTAAYLLATKLRRPDTEVIKLRQDSDAFAELVKQSEVDHSLGLPAARASANLTKVSASVTGLSTRVVGHGPLSEDLALFSDGKNTPSEIGVRVSLGYYLTLDFVRFLRQFNEHETLFPNQTTASAVVFRVTAPALGYISKMGDATIDKLRHARYLEPTFERKGSPGEPLYARIVFPVDQGDDESFDLIPKSWVIRQAPPREVDWVFVGDDLFLPRTTSDVDPRWE